jgi:hypothetical protein
MKRQKTIQKTIQQKKTSFFLSVRLNLIQTKR